MSQKKQCFVSSVVQGGRILTDLFDACPLHDGVLFSNTTLSSIFGKLDICGFGFFPLQ